MTDTATLSALDRLHTDAEARGWQPDTGRNPRPGCWHDPNDPTGVTEFTVPEGAGDVRILTVSAHTPDRSLRLQVDTCDLDDAIRVLRIVLGWPEGGES